MSPPTPRRSIALATITAALVVRLTLSAAAGSNVPVVRLGQNTNNAGLLTNESYALTVTLDSTPGGEFDPVDADGLTDDRGTELGADPANPDADGDGIDDGREIRDCGSDSLDPADP